LIFDADSLALKALQDGTVDFHDSRVKFTSAKIDISTGKAN